MKREQKNIKIKYDPESDVLSWEISKKPIDNAVEMGNMIVHFSPENTPVLVEILDAKKFLTLSRKAIQEEVSLAM